MSWQKQRNCLKKTGTQSQNHNIMDNYEKSKEFYNKWDCEGGQGLDAIYDMARWKDKRLKQFFIERITTDYTGRVGEDESPIASDYLDWMMESKKAAEALFEEYKNFE